MKLTSVTLAGVLSGLLVLLSPEAHAQRVVGPSSMDAPEARGSIDEALDYARLLKRELADIHAYIRAEREASAHARRSPLSPHARRTYTTYDTTEIFARAGPYECTMQSKYKSCSSCICTTTLDAESDECIPPKNFRVLNEDTQAMELNPTCQSNCKCKISQRGVVRREADRRRDDSRRLRGKPHTSKAGGKQ